MSVTTAEEAHALELDEQDPLKRFRDQFIIPRRPDGRPTIYFCSHSLGLQPRCLLDMMELELENWAHLGVEGHFLGKTPWYTYQELLREPHAHVVGGSPDEVILMNGLSINLHLMLASFFHPSVSRRKIVMDDPPFPSDLYVVKSQLAWHGLDPETDLLFAKHRPDSHAVEEADLEQLLDRQGDEVALVLWSGVNFLTGQAYDLGRVAGAARKAGCLVGFDLAHAAGNVSLELHQWSPDFAVWCTYKYLNSGPGSIAGCFVNQKHGIDVELPRLAGWWGNDPATRFRMQLQPEFIPRPGADGWQVSNPPILALVPIRASLALYEQAGMAALRQKSVALTSYLYEELSRLPTGRFEILTPREPERRGCQLSLRLFSKPREVLKALHEEGVVADFREPDVIRVAPVPLYNAFHEVYQFCRILERLLA